jgi:hypothetical protein
LPSETLIQDEATEERFSGSASTEIRKGEYFTKQSEIRPLRNCLGEEAIQYDSAAWTGQDANGNILMSKIDL